MYCFKLDDGFLIETTDTFLPYYTKNCINGTNVVQNGDIGSRKDRYIIGISTMSGCPVMCRFCATGSMKSWRKLTSEEMLNQVTEILMRNKEHYTSAKEFKINYTRMGSPFLNLDNVKGAIDLIDKYYPNEGKTHHYISTIGIKGSDFSWIKDNITLQISLHSLDEKRRKELIPINNLMTLEELGQIRTKSNLKTTLNLTLVDEQDFDIEKLKKYFDPEFFFCKISPINKNSFSEQNNMGEGIVKGNYLE